ncbi:hypothetical protein C8R44DRAFT_985271 [Mycena epipterygia]|nr:hypothetical protein C8R44DRAFT_985271 [Mycena epipterygia]
MDDEADSGAEFNFESRTDLNDPGSAPYAGAFFPRSQHFVVAGGVFKSKVTNHIHEAPTLPSDFRRIPIGDIDLQREIHLDAQTGVVERSRGRVCVRRMYSAKIEGRKSNMTVALYQGDNAEEEWREAISKYSWLRHPNFVQLYGVASTPGVHAAILQDDLIPYTNFLDFYRNSPILTVYIWAYCDAEFRDATDYFQLVCQMWLRPINCTFWIRCSTGRLCADPFPSGLDGPTPVFFLPTGTFLPHDIISLNEQNQEAAAISSLTLEVYHEISNWHRSHPRISTSMRATANLGGIMYYSLDSQFDDWVEIAHLPDAGFFDSPWATREEVGGQAMDNGWTRYNSGDVFGLEFQKEVWIKGGSGGTWLSQANYIFSRLQITSNYENYAYWSLDPSGVGRLSMAEATQLGFPWIQLTTGIYGASWDASVYAGLRQFHQAKGFDPESQDVARHLKCRLFQLSNVLEVVEERFAHSELQS